MCDSHYHMILLWLKSRLNHTLFLTAFFTLRDRGMGIYSLDTYKYSGYRLRIDNFTLSGKVSYINC